jgi:hypothetical protein
MRDPVVSGRMQVACSWLAAMHDDYIHAPHSQEGWAT